MKRKASAGLADQSPFRGDTTLAKSGKFLPGLVALKSVSHIPVTNQRLNLSERRGGMGLENRASWVQSETQNGNLLIGVR